MNRQARFILGHCGVIEIELLTPGKFLKIIEHKSLGDLPRTIPAVIIKKHGIPIAVVRVDYDSIGVDVPADVERVERLLANASLP